jgi:hypothetical protein
MLFSLVSCIYILDLQHEKRGLKGIGISWSDQMTSGFPIVSLHAAKLVQSGMDIVKRCARISLSAALLHFVNYHIIRTWLHLALCQLHMNKTGKHVRRILFELIGARDSAIVDKNTCGYRCKCTDTLSALRSITQ